MKTSLFVSLIPQGPCVRLQLDSLLGRPGLCQVQGGAGAGGGCLLQVEYRWEGALDVSDGFLSMVVLTNYWPGRLARE